MRTEEMQLALYMDTEHRARVAIYLRSFIFGVEDSIVSTVGLLSGIAIVGTPAKTIVLTGVVLIFVEAFSMAVGSFLSERSSAEYISQQSGHARQSIAAGLIMFASYFVAGFIPLLPYVFADPSTAFAISILFSLVALFLLGGVSARLAGTKIFITGARMLGIGGIAIAVGVAVGKIIG